MAFICFLLSWACLPGTLYLLQTLTQISQPLHEFCLSQFQGTAHFESSSAFLCGRELSDPELHRQLVNVGLYHLVVVSGAHLSFLNQFFRRFRHSKLRFLSPLTMGCFCLLSTWQPPVVRAWMESLSIMAGRRSRPAIFESWILCLALHPQWIHSLSLHLSLAARLALVPKSKNEFRVSLWVLLFLFPLLAGWAPIQPVISLVAVLLAPLGSWLWVLTAISEWFEPQGFKILNSLWSAWDLILNAAGHWQAPVQKINFHSSEWSWCYVLILFFVLHAWQTHAAQRRHEIAQSGMKEFSIIKKGLRS